MFLQGMIAQRTVFHNVPGRSFTCTQKYFYNATGSTAKWKSKCVMNVKSSLMDSNQFSSVLNSSKYFFTNHRQYRTLRHNQYFYNIKNGKYFPNVIFRRVVSNKAVQDNVLKSKRLSTNELRRLFSLAKPEKWRLAGAIGMLFISSAVTMTVPFGLGKVIDVIYATDTEKMKKNLKNLCVILTGIFIIGGLCNFGRVYLMSISGQRITRDLRQKVFNSILSQEVAYFDKNKTGELVNRLSADTALVSQALTTNISDGLRSSVMVVSGISMMFYMSPQLATVGLSVVPPVAALAIIYGRFVRKITVQVQDSLASATSIAQEKISNIRTVKAFSNEPREIRAYGEQVNHVLELAYKESLARGVFFGMTGLTGNIIILTVLYYGGTMVGTTSLTIGSLTSFLMYAFYVGISFGGLSSFYSELNKSLGASTRLWEIVDRIPAIPMTGGLSPALEPKGRITFGNVTFAYPTRKDIPVLQNLNLEIPEASVTAIVGHSGSGKSTIASVLLRLYDPDDGHILIDEFKTVHLNPDWIRKHVGFVSQEPVLFSSSIRDNILYGAIDPSKVNEERLMSVAREANCLEFIDRTPHGFDTKVGERGVMLSGGQKQRIAIARALIKNPRILLLDEATSALDAESEHLVQEALERIMKGRTVLTIAHRLSTVRNADQIVVLEKGRVVEKGTCEELMANENGAFRKLIKHQAFL